MSFFKNQGQTTFFLGGRARHAAYQIAAEKRGPSLFFGLKK